MVTFCPVGRSLAHDSFAESFTGRIPLLTAESRSAANALSASRLTKGSAVRLPPRARAARSNIQDRMDLQKTLRLRSIQRAAENPSALSITAWTPPSRPAQASSRYRTSRQTVPWAFSSLVGQSPATPLATRMENTIESRSPATRDGIWPCAMPMAPHQLPVDPSPIDGSGRTNLTISFKSRGR